MLANKNGGLYTAFKSKDTRFDGRIFVGIASTGIYCRPICRARMPKEKNCTFYSSAAEAEQAGYRPCLLCRPELAPGNAIVDASASLAERTLRLLDESIGCGTSINNIAKQLGCSDRHLRRVFIEHYNVSPVKYLQTSRLLLAKNLLTDTKLSVLEVAMASGFGSLRRFNDLFKNQYRISPTAIRKNSSGEKKAQSITLMLSYRPPYQWQQMLDFLKQRAITGVETVLNGEYCRTVHVVTAEQKHLYGWIKVSHYPQKKSLKVTISTSLLAGLPQVLSKVRHLFDLHCVPDSIYEVLSQMNTIRPDLCTLGTRLPGCFDAFEMVVRAILGQQITVKAAGTLAARIVKTYGTKAPTEIEGLTHVFPAPIDIVAMGDSIAENLGKLGVIARRSNTILVLAKSFVNKYIIFDTFAKPEEEMKKLTEISGIGNWTAQYIAMRTMGWTDAFLETDIGVKKALAPHTAKEMVNLAESWRPWRSYAVINLWNSL